MLTDTFAVLATGPSMGPELAEYIRPRCRAVAVCNAYQIAPWAEALVCNDRTWWRLHADALRFAGRRFCAGKLSGCERLPPSIEFPPGCNSGYQGMRVARMLGARTILLCGFDMHGTHYFGPHPKPLRNTTPKRFKAHIAQFKHWQGKGIEVLNCTPGSSLKQFPFADLRTVLEAKEVA